jgi:hypothetical protein
VVAHKYGNKKGRTSSPAPFPTSVVKPDENCDEVSTALEISEDSPPHKTKKKTDITPAADKAFSGVATRTRAAAMKNKKNEIAPAPVVKVTKRAAPKAKPNPAQFVSQARKKSMPEQSKETKEELQSNSSSASPQLMRPNVPMVHPFVSFLTRCSYILSRRSRIQKLRRKSPRKNNPHLGKQRTSTSSVNLTLNLLSLSKNLLALSRTTLCFLFPSKMRYPLSTLPRRSLLSALYMRKMAPNVTTNRT